SSDGGLRAPVMLARSSLRAESGPRRTPVADRVDLMAQPDRNLALELVRATEAAAIRAVPFIGKGDKLAADGAAVDAIRAFLATVHFDGVVVIGEGEKDKAPMLFNGE